MGFPNASRACFLLDQRCAARRYTLDAAASVLDFDPSDATFLGKGAAASVYRGTLSGTPVAIKVAAACKSAHCLGELASAR